MKNKEKILQILKSATEPVSGESLKETLNISRTAVWKNINTLKNAGYKIIASHSGYLLKKEEDILTPLEFEDNLYIYRESTDSTMNVAARMAADPSVVTGTTIIAGVQSQGKSSGKKKWESQQGGLYTTVILKPRCSFINVMCYPMAAALAAAELLNQRYDLGAVVSWPFEVRVQGKKITGILPEFQCENGILSWINIGIGMNLNNTPSPGESCSLIQLIGKRVSRQEILMDLRNRLLTYCQTPEKTLEIYNSSLGKNVTELTIERDGSEFQASLISVDSLGSLKVLNQGKEEILPLGSCKLIWPEFI